MRKLLTIFLALLLIGSVGAITKTLPKWGPAQGFQAKEIQVDTLTAETITASTNVTNGVFADDLTLDSGYDFTANAGDGKFDLHLATGTFDTSTGANTFNGDGTFAAGKTLTCAAGFIGPLTGAVTGDITGDITGNVTAAGTVQAEQITSTDDVLVYGTLTANDVVSNTTVVAADLTASDDAIITDDLTVDGGARIDETLTVNAVTINTTLNGNIPTIEETVTFPYTASSVDQQIFTAKEGWQITAVRMVPRVAGVDGSAVNVMLKLCDDAEAPASGDNALTGTLDLKGTADTIQSGTLSGTPALANGDSLALDFTGTMTSAVGVVTIYMKRV